MPPIWPRLQGGACVQAFPKVVTRFSELLPAGWDWSASKGGALAATEGSTSEDAREFAESQKGLYSLMSALVLNSLGHVLLKVRSPTACQGRGVGGGGSGPCVWGIWVSHQDVLQLQAGSLGQAHLTFGLGLLNCGLQLLQTPVFVCAW